MVLRGGLSGRGRVGEPGTVLSRQAVGRGMAPLRRAGRGDGGMFVTDVGVGRWFDHWGRITLGLCPSALSGLAAGRTVVLVSGTNGKTATSHLFAAALRTEGPVAHNVTGSNMADGAVAALSAAPTARCAVLEIDELHLGRVVAAVRPDVVVLLNLTRDQLDRGTEVRAIAAAVSSALARHPGGTVVANADDPMVVAATRYVEDVVWVGAGGSWSGDAATCPCCGRLLEVTGDGSLAGEVRDWRCCCGLSRPRLAWTLTSDGADTPSGPVALRLKLPGRFNRANAVMAMAAAAQLGVGPARAVAAMTPLTTVSGRYQVFERGNQEVRLLLAKNPAGWAETMNVLEDVRWLLIAVNSCEADGRDTSWLWDVEFERFARRTVVACGQRASDVGLRNHHTVSDPIAGLELLPPGKVDVVANYTTFAQLHRRLIAPDS